MKPNASKSIFGFATQVSESNLQLLSTPSNLWGEDHLEQLYGTEFLKHSFDYQFLKMASEFSHPRRYHPPNEELIKQFFNECSDLHMMTTAIEAQTEKVKQMKA